MYPGTLRLPKCPTPAVNQFHQHEAKPNGEAKRKLVNGTPRIVAPSPSTVAPYAYTFSTSAFNTIAAILNR